MAYSNRNQFWFGTAGSMDWFPTPVKGAEMNPEGWSAGGTLLNGGGYQFNSFGSHKTYTFEWRDSSAIEAAAKMKAYSDGTYGRGLIHFVDPLIYEKNTAPAQISDPSIAIGYEGVSMVYGVEPTGTPTPNRRKNGLPVTSAVYSLGGVDAGFRGTEGAVFLPIPEGHALALGAVYTATGSGGIFVSWQDSDGVIHEAQRLTEVDPEADTLLPDIVIQGEGVWVWVGKESAGSASVTFSAFISRLVRKRDVAEFGLYGDGFYGQFTYGEALPRVLVQRLITGPWMAGLGHSGCRFIGKPTYVANGPFNGGQVGFAASFREVGMTVRA